jgi:hypothetical protein
MVERKCRWTSFDLNRSERPPTGNLRSRPAMHTQERKLVAISKSGELPAERSNSVGLVEAIGEESYAKWRCQQVVSKPKLAGNCFFLQRLHPARISILDCRLLLSIHPATIY